MEVLRAEPDQIASSKQSTPAIETARLGFVLLIAVLALAAAGKAILYDTLDPDLFWHLRVADQLAALPYPQPLVDQLSFASIKTPWTPYSWLAELGQRWVWIHGGYRAAVAIQAIMAGATVCLIAMIAVEMSRTRRAMHLNSPSPGNPGEGWGEGRSSSSSQSSVLSPQSFLSGPHPNPLPEYRERGQETPRYLTAALAAFVGEFLCLPYLSFRPVTLAILILGVIAWLLSRDQRMNNHSRAVWLIPPLTALMANIHLYVIFAPLAVFGCFLWKRPGLLIATILASLMTPMLPGAIAAAWHYQFDDVMVAAPLISEMRPIWHGPMGIFSAALALLVIVMATIRRRELSGGQWRWLIACLILLLRMGRFAPLFAIFAAPTLAVTLASLRNDVLGKNSIVRVLAIVAFLELAKIAAAFPTPATPLSQWLNRMGPDAGGYPTAAADFVRNQIAARTHRIICEFTWGGYLEWRLNPTWQLLMDGRTQLFTSDFWKNLYLGTPQERKAYLKTIAADAAIIPAHGSSFKDDLIDLGWKVAYADERAEVLVKQN